MQWILATHKFCKLIKFSPKRASVFQKLKAEIQPGSPGVRVLCPTHWTVWADALKSVNDNYTVLQELWELCYDEVKDTETKARIHGYLLKWIHLNTTMGSHLQSWSYDIQLVKHYSKNIYLQHKGRKWPKLSRVIYNHCEEMLMHIAFGKQSQLKQQS